MCVCVGGGGGEALSQVVEGLGGKRQTDRQRDKGTERERVFVCLEFKILLTAQGHLRKESERARETETDRQSLPDSVLLCCVRSSSAATWIEPTSRSPAS